MMSTITSDSHRMIRSFGSFLGSDRRADFAIVLVFLPWIVAVFAMSGPWAALGLLCYSFMAYIAGYGILGIAVPASDRISAIVFAPALGILFVSSVAGLWLRLGYSLIWVPALWTALIFIGLPFVWTDRSRFKEKSVPYGASLVALSILVCAVFFYPSARKDAVLKSDGGFNWIYVDTQFFYSIAADIESGAQPPRIPGATALELRYHFAPYAPAAVISRFSWLNLGDAFARITRGASIWALLLSCFGLGTILSVKATGRKFGGVASVAGLFFYGSLFSLFTDAYNSSGYVTGALLFKIPEVDVLADGGPFSHLILGHSVLHGLICITAIMGLCLIEQSPAILQSPRILVLLLLPAMAVPMNSVAALYCLGTVGILLFWNSLGQVRSWGQIALAVSIFYCAWAIMDYRHSPDLVASSIDRHPQLLWWPLAVEFTAGLGIRLLGFRWISHPRKNPFAALVLIGSFGLLLFYGLLQLEGNERYGIYYLQAMFSIFAFSRFTPEFWHGAERSRLVAEWLSVARLILVLVFSSGVLIGIIAMLLRHPTDIPFFRSKLLICFLVLLSLSAISTLLRRSQLPKIGPLFLMATLMIGFLAWITPWLNYGMGRARRDVSLTPGEVQGLMRFREVAARGELFATNKHAVDSLVADRERSYGYTALSERPVVLEGYMDHGVAYIPGFSTLLSNNDLMFTTTEPTVLRQLAETYHVHWLIARPGTDIELPRPRPSWLQEQSECGDLRIYKIE